MKRRKTLQELTIKDNFMFGAVMCDERNIVIQFKTNVLN